MRSKIRLTVVIPIWNDPAPLREILATIAGLLIGNAVTAGMAAVQTGEIR